MSKFAIMAAMTCGRFTKTCLVLLLLLLPNWVEAYGYYYMKQYRGLANQAAERIYVSETTAAPHAYEEIKALKKKANTPAGCVKRLKRQAIRDKGDGIIALKYQGFEKTSWLVCEGKLVRWKPSSETQETQKKEL